MIPWFQTVFLAWNFPKHLGLFSKFVAIVFCLSKWGPGASGVAGDFIANELAKLYFCVKLKAGSVGRFSAHIVPKKAVSTVCIHHYQQRARRGISPCQFKLKSSFNEGS